MTQWIGATINSLKENISFINKPIWQSHVKSHFGDTKKSKKQKYRGMFETQKSGNNTSSGDIGLNLRTLASPKVGQDQVSGGVSVLCWHAAPVENDGSWPELHDKENVFKT